MNLPITTPDSSESAAADGVAGTGAAVTLADRDIVVGDGRHRRDEFGIPGAAPRALALANAARRWKLSLKLVG